MTLTPSMYHARIEELYDANTELQEDLIKKDNEIEELEKYVEELEEQLYDIQKELKDTEEVLGMYREWYGEYMKRHPNLKYGKIV